MFLVFSRVWNKEKIKKKNIFPYLFTKLETYHLSYFIYKHDATNIAYLSSMQHMYHKNFVIDPLTIKSL